MNNAETHPPPICDLIIEQPLKNETPKTALISL